MEEIARIEHFFLQKQNELINQFILLQDKFRIKADLYENEKQDKQKKKQKKEQEALQDPAVKRQNLQNILSLGTPNRGGTPNRFSENLLSQSGR